MAPEHQTSRLIHIVRAQTIHARQFKNFFLIGLFAHFCLIVELYNYIQIQRRIIQKFTTLKIFNLD